MWTNVFTFVFLALIGSSVLADDAVYISLRKGLEDYITSKNKSVELEYASRNLQMPRLFRNEDKSAISKVACTTCITAIDVVIAARRAGAKEKDIIDILEKICIWLRIESEPVCIGAIRIYSESIVYIVDHRKDLTSMRVCNIILQDFRCKDPYRKDWQIDIPEPTKHAIDMKQRKEVADYFKKNAYRQKPLTVLHLTDLHYDPGYEVGSNGACDEPLCCQKSSKPSNSTGAAGHWGDYRQCDSPWHMVVDSLEHIVEQHEDIDFVYFTGDIINHKVWDTNVEGNKKAISDVYRVFRKLFKNKTVYPILGNHEPHPVNLFSSDGVDSPKLDSHWVFDLVLSEWITWLPIDTANTILKGGYYTALIKPGFRVIALNSNVCYTFNWWLLYDDVDPYDQLKWLVEVLLKAEENDEVVHILSHIPNGQSSCLNNWSREYLRIVNRFSHIIAAQFNGHTHYDSTYIYFNRSNSFQAINVAFDGGSLTTYLHLNPNYKIFSFDPNTFEVLDYDLWMFNMTEGNLSPNVSPHWYKLYSFKEAYGVESLRPQELALLAERIARDPRLSQLYFRYKVRDADTSLAKGCDTKCELDNLCSMVTSQAEDTLHCELYTSIYNDARN